MSETTVNDLGLTDASCACGTHTHSSTNQADASCACGTHTHSRANQVAAPADGATNTFQVLGMTCSHCVASVTKEIGKLARAEDVTVDLVPGGVSLVTVTGAPLDRTAVAAAIDEAGYELVAES